MRATNFIKFTLYSFIILGAFSPLFAQDRLLKSALGETFDRKICLYPSTLRMANLERNEEVDEVVNDIRKVLIFTFSPPSELKELSETMDQYQERGFEEYATMHGGRQLMKILGKENEAYVGYFGNPQQSMAFYIDGTLRWEKIPSLMRTLQTSQLMNFFDLANMELDGDNPRDQESY